MIFTDRIHAGQILAQRLRNFNKDLNAAIVVSIPRGGVLVGAQIAKIFKLPIFLLVIKKLGAPNNSELAIGATASFGKPVLDRWLIANLDVPSDYIKQEVLNKRREAKAREKFLGIKIEPKKFEGKTIIVVDDGLATGQTAKMAAKILKQLGSGKLILAVPCASSAVIEETRKDYNEVICPQIRDDFAAVGQFYRDFRPVEDEEVKQLLSSQLTTDH
ncbi:hypothetical protein A3A60_04540 [Candidatus Curtissbacteria bacterium RIFCSPLOWO2_01_FULL_42_26]|uniref:Phosphoribosyltransferase domain-containing protein n=1 Tax=Candidatus Curtissbacteria bacterium RIFCSPLOWO2_01_FULL_42_26 TaxID=1797729 RepID=A0A1F5HX09_9BACT|nr:MAG: hypothetical protein A3A60_04540 [Candidatus Curtissbacteria bacterium RIFCSPLOWO2_01_FULL_42_26]